MINSNIYMKLKPLENTTKSEPPIVCFKLVASEKNLFNIFLFLSPEQFNKTFHSYKLELLVTSVKILSHVFSELDLAAWNLVIACSFYV